MRQRTVFQEIIIVPLQWAFGISFSICFFGFFFAYLWWVYQL
jgi:hypothetical protein